MPVPRRPLLARRPLWGGGSLEWRRLLSRRGLRQIALYRAGSWVSGSLPAAATYVVTDLVSAMAARFPSDATRGRRAVVGAHVARIYGSGGNPRSLGGAEAGAAVDATFRSYGRYWAENLYLPAVGPAGLSAGMSSDGFEHLFAAYAQGRGVILALPHLGGWEWGGAWLAAQGLPVSVVVEPLDPPEAFAWFVRFRRSLGLEVIPAGPAAGAATLRALRSGRILCLLCDRVVGAAAGLEVDFFGTRTLLPAGPTLLGIRSSAPVLPAAVYFTPGRPGHLAVVRPPLAFERGKAGRLRADLERGTQALAGELEILIRRAPTQWHLMQPNWPGDPGWEGLT